MKRNFTLFAACLLLAACSSTPDVVSYISPYRIDVRQGNMVTQDMVAQLKPGMTKDQVRFVLGTPLLVDIFHKDRWDYVYRLQPGRGEVQQRRMTVFFDDGKLARVAGDVVADDGSPPAPGTEASPRNRVIEIGVAAPAPKAEAKPDEKPQAEQK